MNALPVVEKRQANSRFVYVGEGWVAVYLKNSQFFTENTVFF